MSSSVCSATPRHAQSQPISPIDSIDRVSRHYLGSPVNHVTIIHPLLHRNNDRSLHRSIDRFANGSVYISNETRGRKISGFDSALIPRLLSRLVERKEEGRMVGGNFRDNRGKVDPGHRVVNTLFPCIKQTRDSPPLERPNPSLSLSLFEVSPLERIELKRETSVVHSR